MVAADLYRGVAALLDWRGHLRRVAGRPVVDVACITNLEHEGQRPFLGLAGRRRPVADGLRFWLGEVAVRYALINSTTRELMTAEGRERARREVRAAIERAVGRGARVILFAAMTKRLFDDGELRELRRRHPGVVFTIGDNGTAQVLLGDLFAAIERRGLGRSSRILVIGPNGFLGGAVVAALRQAGFSRVVTASARERRPFDGLSDIELVVACSHHLRVRLTAAVLEAMAHEGGVCVVDVCRPSNLSPREWARCRRSVERVDGGTVRNRRLRYIFAAGAAVILRSIGLSLTRLYGCFAEGVALGYLGGERPLGIDFMTVNEEATRVVSRALAQAGFVADEPRNFGRPIERRHPSPASGRLARLRA